MKLECCDVLRIALLIVLGALFVSGALGGGLGLALKVHAQAAQAEPAAKVIRIDTAPRDGVRTLRMRELWRTDPEAQEYLFGFIDAAVADREGRVFLLDRQVGDVKVFAPDGRFLRTMSGRGEGPGETQTPRELVLASDGQLGVVEEFPARIAFLDREGRGAGSWALRFSDGTERPLIAFKQVMIRGSRTYASYARIFFDTKEELNGLAAFNADGDLLVTYVERRRHITDSADADLEYRGFGRGHWDVDAGGTLYALEKTGEYRITARDSTGAVVMTLERAFPRRTRTAEEIARLQEVFKAEESVASATTAAELAPAIRMLHVAQNGELWVLTDAPASVLQRTGVEGPIATLADVFSGEGEYLRQIVIQGEVDWDKDRWIWIAADRVIILRDRASALAAEQAALRRASARAGGRAVEAEAEPGQEMVVVCFALTEAS